ncbi:MAG TPA: hypothetical protein VKT28_05340 [Puia sp.]|nr:hypothetical protein [Puia sp.]
MSKIALWMLAFLFILSFGSFTKSKNETKLFGAILQVTNHTSKTITYFSINSPSPGWGLITGSNLAPGASASYVWVPGSTVSISASCASSWAGTIQFTVGSSGVYGCGIQLTGATHTLNSNAVSGYGVNFVDIYSTTYQCP